MFDPAGNLLTPRNADGSFVAGITPTTTGPYVEGDAYEYLWNTPNDYSTLFSLLGGKSAVVPALKQYLSQPNGFGMFAQLTNEFDFGEQNALDYAGDPAGTQQAVNNIRDTMYPPGPSGLQNNDDLGANSSSFLWEMLGLYPENSGSDNLVFASPGFPHAAISLPNGRSISIDAPGASPSRYYVDSLRLNGRRYDRLYVPYSALNTGRLARLHPRNQADVVGQRAAGRAAVVHRGHPSVRRLPPGPDRHGRAGREHDGADRCPERHRQTPGRERHRQPTVCGSRSALPRARSTSRRMAARR